MYRAPSCPARYVSAPTARQKATSRAVASSAGPPSSTPSSEARTTGVTTPSASASHRLLGVRSEEHTSELQSRFDLVCRLLLEKKKNITNSTVHVLGLTD